MSSTDRQARMGLCALAPLGAPAVVRAVEEFGPVDIWEGFRAQGPDTAWGRRAQAVDLTQLDRATHLCGSRFLTPGDEEWPAPYAALAETTVSSQTGAPFGLWVRGRDLTALTGGVAIVGSRACTTYGEHAALTFAADLAAGGRTIISGLAFGIDAAAHRGALGMRGTTVAVVASGVDVPYPRGNRALADAIVGRGAIISELPPGYSPTRYAFLARNRLIAALSAAVVIVEAAHRSGAKNTTSWGNALGIPVLAVPGPITSSLSATPHRLIRDAEATLVTSADEVEAALAPLGTVPEPTGRGRDTPVDKLPPALFELREAVGGGETVGASQLAARTGQSMIEVLSNAAELVEGGWLEENPDGTFRLPGRPIAS
ncbi:DNA-processing protein DprA [Tessaracoccus flavus]|uniref:DNA protecting protein DprA n=1 Tax=Tessaracoccus flavus TaxID=1610493 RepID=A0A1Q2CFF2_9ACTN|nr:DNA-processing protein DprA [Tessaracoccus flavus]AQP44833.1 DNA protecting protein DprA [Tessaracoccus flavus]SDY96528.1 DNA processing protein [Tessaracoccus flavus]